MDLLCHCCPQICPFPRPVTTIPLLRCNFILLSSLLFVPPSLTPSRVACSSGTHGKSPAFPQLFFMLSECTPQLLTLLGGAFQNALGTVSQSEMQLQREHKQLRNDIQVWPLYSCVRHPQIWLGTCAEPTLKALIWYPRFSQKHLPVTFRRLSQVSDLPGLNLNQHTFLASIWWQELLCMCNILINIWIILTCVSVGMCTHWDVCVCLCVLYINLVNSKVDTP